jgi:glycosyltransferase involved in cell wall biosynthesis
MHKILIISYFFYPDQTPRSFRWTDLVKYFAKKGFQIDVITASQSNEKINSADGRIRIFRSKRSFIDAIIEKNRENSSSVNNQKGQSQSWIKSLNKIIRIVYRSTLYQIFWPDKMVLWMPEAVRQGRALCRENSYDCIISVSLPFIANCIGYKLKKEFGYRWIAEYGDPFSGNKGLRDVYGFRVLSVLDKFMESRILRKADAVSVPTSESVNHFVSLFPFLQDRIHLIPQFFVELDEKKVSAFEKEIYLYDDVIHIVYAGRLYKSIRNPEILFKSLHSAKKGNSVQIHLIGDTEEVQEEIGLYRNCGLNIIEYGSKKREFCAAFYRKADITINILNQSTTQVPSKNAECLFYSKRLIELNPMISSNMLGEGKTIKIRYDLKNLLSNIDQVLSWATKEIKVSEKNDDSFVTVDNIGKYYVNLMGTESVRKDYLPIINK